jgi:hypothetical protein
MKKRVFIWAALGFILACCWVGYTFVVSPDHLLMSLRKPAVQAFEFISFPMVFLARFPIHFWWVPFINAGTYAAVGLIFELLRSRPERGVAV